MSAIFQPRAPIIQLNRIWGPTEDEDVLTRLVGYLTGGRYGRLDEDPTEDDISP